MSVALYRKYRSKSFKEVLGQEHITTTLVNSIKKGTFAHAYLLTGPHGVGKTSVARLFAYSVNGLDYKDTGNYPDIIEIDAASNRRIDEIRELREKVGIAPSSLKYKVYIVDEVHMLTKEAFNALLKTLEEPPSHVIFILATTDFHKVPETIASRCVRFAFRPIAEQDLNRHLGKIAEKESIDIEEGAIGIISQNSGGSFRDGLSLLDQFRNSKDKVTADYVSSILGLGPDKSITGLLDGVKDSDARKIISAMEQLRAAGSNDSRLVKQVIARLRSDLIENGGNYLGREKTLRLMDALLKINEYSDVSLAFELVLLKECSASGPAAAAVPPEAPKSAPKPAEAPRKTAPASKKTGSSQNNDLWQAMLDKLKNKNSTLYGIARMAEPKYNDSTLELYFEFPFHYKQMKLERNFSMLKQTLADTDVEINAIELKLNKDDPDYQPVRRPQTANEPVSDISNIFGSAEVLES